MDVSPPIADTLYWLFLAGWSLFAAYLIVVRQVYIVFAHKLDEMFFGAGAPTKIHTPGQSHAPSGGHTESHGHAAHPPLLKNAHPDEHPPHLFKPAHLGHPHYFVGLPEQEEIIHPNPSSEMVDEFIVTQIQRTK